MSVYLGNQKIGVTDMIDKGLDIKPSSPTVNGKWQRPSNYPDLSKVTIGNDFDGVYLTYDLNKTPEFPFIFLIYSSLLEEILLF